MIDPHELMKTFRIIEVKCSCNKTESEFSPRSRANGFYSYQFFQIYPNLFKSIQIFSNLSSFPYLLNFAILRTFNGKICSQSESLQICKKKLFLPTWKNIIAWINLFLQRAKNKSIPNHSRLIRNKQSISILQNA